MLVDYLKAVGSSINTQQMCGFFPEILRPSAFGILLPDSKLSSTSPS